MNGPPTSVETVRRVVAEAVWAPSVHNTQPWRFTGGGQEISLHADASRKLGMSDPEGRQMMISCGAALFTVRLVLRSLGWIPLAEVLPDPSQPLLVARVRWQEQAPPTELERRLATQVRQRHTHRGGFDPEPLPPGLLAVLRQGATRDGAMLRIVADDGQRAALAAAVQIAERVLELDSQRVQELTRWSAPPGSARADGVHPDSYPVRPEHTDPDFPGRDFAHGHGWGMPPPSTRPLFRCAGVAGLLTTTRDRPADWVNAGQALQRILLTASARGIAAALHTQPFELRWLREAIRTELAHGAYPHLVLRLGAVVQATASVRRPPDDVLVQMRADDVAISEP
ncbi:MAG TPA: nitroreductase family protein [Streptosporangiaceae bacterium]|nr:nitroreductase family protein [Streptosporangiaceae bacterium]